MHVTSESTIRRRVSDTPVVYMLFDVLWLEGHMTMPLPYTERRARLEALDLNGDNWRTPSYHVGDGKAMLEASNDQGLEGVVAKRLDSRYEPGSRSGAWLKIKNKLSQEFVIGGWLPGEGGRRDTLGSLAVGYLRGRQAALCGQRGHRIHPADARGPALRAAEAGAPRQPVRGSPAAEGHPIRRARAGRGGRIQGLDEDTDVATAFFQRPPGR